MKWLRCNCGNVFREMHAAELPVSEHFEAAGACGVRVISIQGCPECRSSEDLDDHEKCENSDCFNSVLDGCDECSRCFAEHDPAAFSEYLREYGPTLKLVAGGVA